MKKHSYDIVVIGAGLAGTSVAFALAKRSLKVLVLDSCDGVATQASGNRFGLIMPYISDRASGFERLYSEGFRFTREAVTTHLAHYGLFRETGGVQLPATERLAHLLASTAPLTAPTPIHRLSPQEAGDVIGIPSAHGCFHIPLGGYVEPAALARALCNEITSVRLKSKVFSIRRDGDHWACELSNGTRVTSSGIVICAAYRTHGFPLLADMPLEPVHGQTITVEPSVVSSRIRSLICFNGYVTPEERGSHLLGAHYQHFDLRQIPADEDSHSIISSAQRWFPSLDFTKIAHPTARVCFRTSTFDRLPYIGAAIDTTLMRKEAKSFRSGTDLMAKVGVAPVPGIYMSVGHGSRGLLSCPLGGEIIARLVTGESLGLLADIAKTVSPHRIAPRLLQHDIP